MSCAERKRLLKNCGLSTRDYVGDNKQKISPNLAKRTDFLVHKAQILVGVTGFEPAASTSQTSRATSCATPRSVKNIEFLRFFRKWSNMWSNRFLQRFCERAECRKSQCLQGFSAFFDSGYLGGGVLLPNVARYQLRHTPMCDFYSIFRSIL